MKKSITFMLALLMLLTFSTVLATPLLDNHNLTPMEAIYVGATTTGKFHYTTCYWANKIREDHRIYFESREEAVYAGYVPCKVCKP